MTDRSVETPRVRVRGIYSTALTQTLRDRFEIVQASPPIRERFEDSFSDASHHVAVETTDDRLGVAVTGTDAVSAVVDHLAETGIDTLSWTDPTPAGAIYDTTVEETLGSGAVVALTDDQRGYLPFGTTDEHVTEGDRYRVQVFDPAPPWSDDRPVVGPEIQAEAGLATLVRGSDGVRVEGASDRELAGLTELLSTDVPDGWGLRWRRGAADADMDALDDALSAASKRAARIDDALADAAPPSDAAPTDRLSSGETAWVLFGRESRFELDDCRRAVAPTMPGHHRIKAGDERASAAVDLVEAVCDGVGDADAAADPDGEFPFDAVTRQFGPRVDDRVAIEHGKPHGELITLGRADVTEIEADGSVTLERSMSPGGTYDALGTERERGDVAVTSITEGRWWYPTVYRDEDGTSKGTYVNICTPVEVFPDAVRYVDLHVDVVKHRDGTVERVDDDELDDAVTAGYVSEQLAERARSVASAVERALN